MAEPVHPRFTIPPCPLPPFPPADSRDEAACRVYKAIGDAYRRLGAVDQLAFFHEHIDEDTIERVLRTGDADAADRLAREQERT